MRLSNRIGITASALFFASAISVGCTTNESQLEDTMAKPTTEASSSLTAGVESLSLVDNVQGKSQLSATSIVFFINNTTQADQTFLIWNTPFENPLSANLFRIQLNGETVAYQGRLVKRGTPSAEHYQSIAAGEVIKTVINLGNYYDLSLPGAYDVQLATATTDHSHQQDDQASIDFLPDAVTISVP